MRAISQSRYVYVWTDDGNAVSELPPPPTVNGGKDVDSMDEDYVYDVFYHRPTTARELYDPASSANIAKLYVSIRSQFIAPTNLPPRMNSTGLPPELSGLSGEDSSDEEYSDEDDEDSNGQSF